MGDKIFLSYRRSDSEDIAGRIYDTLVNRFGEDKVVFDVDSVPLGADFREHIRKELESSKAAVIIIGRNWCEEFGRRAAQAGVDHVLAEIEAARELGLPMLPILVGGASWPVAEMLPEPIRFLAFLNGHSIASGKDFRAHVDRLVRALREVPARTAPGPAFAPVPPAPGSSGKGQESAAEPRPSEPRRREVVNSESVPGFTTSTRHFGREELKALARTLRKGQVVPCPRCGDGVQVENLILHYDRRCRLLGSQPQRVAQSALQEYRTLQLRDPGSGTRQVGWFRAWLKRMSGRAEG